MMSELHGFTLNVSMTTILMNGIDFCIGIIGIPANFILIISILFTKDNKLKAYSLILFNSALTDFIAVIVELMAMTRMISEFPYLVHIYEGFCTHISTSVCRISMLIELHLMFHSIPLIAVAFWYRNAVLSGGFPSSIKAQTIICVIMVPMICSASIFAFSDDSKRILPQFYPSMNLTEVAHSSCNFDDTCLKFVGLWTMTTPVIAYSFIFYFRRQVYHKMNSVKWIMSDKTKQMHASLLKALSYHSMLPSLSILGVIGFIAQNLGVQSVLIERAAFLVNKSCSLPPAINPLLTLYFVTPYRRLILKKSPLLVWIGLIKLASHKCHDIFVARLFKLEINICTKTSLHNELGLNTKRTAEHDFIPCYFLSSPHFLVSDNQLVVDYDSNHHSFSFYEKKSQLFMNSEPYHLKNSVMLSCFPPLFYAILNL